MSSLKTRILKLEQQAGIGEQVVIHFADGSTRVVPLAGRGDRLVVEVFRELIERAWDQNPNDGHALSVRLIREDQRTAELAALLMRQDVTAIEEPCGGHLLELCRALLLSPHD
jgi:hypothetical protein